MNCCWKDWRFLALAGERSAEAFVFSFDIKKIPKY
jgi:hypothetical protein